MQIKISSLKVKNCGALKDVKIDLTDTSGNPQAVTVLGGANGSGKTTVLELIFTLSVLLSLAPKTQLNHKNKLQEILGTESAEMELLIDGTTCHLFLGQAPIHNIKHGMINNAMKYYIQSSDSSSNITERIKQYEANALVSELKNSEAIASILYFPHVRELPLVEAEQIYREEVKYRWCFRYENRQSFQNSLESYLIWLDYADHDTFKSVIDFLNQLDFEGKTFHINRKQLNVIVKTRDGNEHPLNQLSSGEQSILIMLLELWRRLLPGSIVLIDEIENSLHPAFQHRLAKNLLQLQQQIPFQLILTTHQYAFVKIFGEQCARILTEF
jgi:AAA15 family ATPase/GTPase